MELLNLKHSKREPPEDKLCLATQLEEMGLAIGEIRRQNSRWRKYLETTKSRQSWLRRWFSLA